MLQDLLEDANLRLEELDSLRASWREALSGETSSLDALASVQHDLALRLDECASLRERALVLEKQNVKLEQMLDDEREANAEMERRLHESSQECATLKGVVAEKQKHYVELKKEADTMRTELEKLRKTCEEQQKRLVRLDELEEEYPILQADKAEAESRLAALQKQVTGGAEVSEDVLDRIARMQLLHATLDEELSDMMLSYGALSPKKQREVIAMQQRYRVATLPTDDFERVTAANQSRTYAAAPGASGAPQDDDMGSIIDNGSELDDMLSDTFSVPATPRDHAAMDNNNKSGAAQNKGHHSRQGSTVVVENARVRDDSDDEDY
jgi:myosin heavy subunit